MLGSPLSAPPAAAMVLLLLLLPGSSVESGGTGKGTSRYALSISLINAHYQSLRTIIYHFLALGADPAIATFSMGVISAYIRYLRQIS